MEGRSWSRWTARYAQQVRYPPFSLPRLHAKSRFVPSCDSRQPAASDPLTPRAAVKPVQMWTLGGG